MYIYVYIHIHIFFYILCVCLCDCVCAFGCTSQSCWTMMWILVCRPSAYSSTAAAASLPAAVTSYVATRQGCDLNRWSLRTWRISTISCTAHESPILDVSS